MPPLIPVLEFTAVGLTRPPPILASHPAAADATQRAVGLGLTSSLARSILEELVEVAPSLSH